MHPLAKTWLHEFLTQNPKTHALAVTLAYQNLPNRSELGPITFEDIKKAQLALGLITEEEIRQLHEQAEKRAERWRQREEWLRGLTLEAMYELADEEDRKSVV